MKKKYLGKTLGSLLIVLLMMPLGHALMILMEHFLEPTTLHYSAFLMGFVGLVITIAGVFVKGDTRQTCFGLAGALLFWTGWVEFLFAYFAQRFGVHCDLIGNGVVQTVTEYVNGVGVNHTFTINGTPLEDFSRAELKELRGSRPISHHARHVRHVDDVRSDVHLLHRTGCLFIRWVQRHCGINEKVDLRPMAYHPSIVMFMEWNIMMWGLYMLLMFCYDPVFLGDHHPVTYAVAAVCLVGSALMFKKQMYIATWGCNLRMAYATVIVFWTFVEVIARNGLFKEIWVDPLHHVVEMSAVLALFVVLIVGCWMYNVKDAEADAKLLA